LKIDSGERSLVLLKRSLSILTPKDQRKILLLTAINVLMSVLDLLGVILVGLLGALSVQGLQSNLPGNRVGTALEILHIQDLSFQTQAMILALSAAALLVGRTVLSIFFTRKMLFFLSRRGAKISAELVSRLLSQPLLVVQERTTQETVYAVTTGVERNVLQVLAIAVVWISDLALLIVLLLGLLIVDPATAIATFLIFLIIASILYKFMHVRAGLLGLENASLSIKSNEKIVEVFASYRESVVRNRRDYYAREIGHLRHRLANTSAEMGFLPYVSKYVIETTIILGAIGIGATQFLFQDATRAVSTLAIFLAAGTRIAPAVLRLQQGLVTIKSGLGEARPTLDLITALGDTPITKNVDDMVNIIHKGFVPEVLIENITLTYPNKLKRAIDGISILIPAGTSIAIVGPSGAGKTTIIDVLLGVLKPDSGSITISGLPPLLAVAKWPGAVSYVPQDVVIAAGTIRENISLGYPSEQASDELIMGALKIAHLDQFVASLPQGLDTQVGERGAKISGGQRQRIGIARAMFTRPHLLVLDEATSSLDGETEASISEAIQGLQGSTTVVIIAHRLSTVRNVDAVIYLADGKLIAKGTFEEVRKAVPEFDQQARVMGL
jgi:ABC-type multidrug transport system fused ATPase/permease subunit